MATVNLNAVVAALTTKALTKKTVAKQEAWLNKQLDKLERKLLKFEEKAADGKKAVVKMSGIEVASNDKGNIDAAVTYTHDGAAFDLDSINSDFVSDLIEAGTPDPEEPEEPGTPGSTFALSTAKDTVVGTSDDDTITGTAGQLNATDLIIDSKTTDADVLTAAVTSYAAGVTSTIANIETVNVNGDYTTTGLALTNVTATQTLNLNTSIASGTATVIDAAAAAAAKIVSGTNVSNLSVTALAAGTAGSVTVDAALATSTTVDGGAGADTFNVTVKAGTGVALDIDGGAGTDDYTINLGGGKLGLTVAAGAAETVTFNSIGGAANTVTLASANALLATSGLVKGDQNLTISGDLDALTGLKITQDATFTGAFNLESTAALTAGEFNKVEADEINFKTANPALAGLTLNSATTARLSVDTGTTTTWDAANAAGTATDTMRFIVAVDQTKIDMNSTATEVIHLSAASTAGKGVTVTLLDTDAATNVQTIVLTGSEKLTISTLTSDANSVLSASDMTGVLVVSAVTNAATVIGGSANDSITGSASADLIRGNAGNDTLTGLAGADTVYAGAGDDIVAGGDDADTLYGEDGADHLSGEAAADTISGGAGNDTIVGGAADDNLTGGEGNDIFVFEATSNGIDTITDFQKGLDKLDLSATVAAATNTVTAVAKAAQSAVADDAVYLISTDGTAASLTTNGTATLASTDFEAGTLTNVAAFLAERISDTDTSGAIATFVVNYTAAGSTKSYVYQYVEGGTGTAAIEASEVTLVGIVTRDAELTGVDVQV